MNAVNILLTTGLACIIAAIIGGGLRAFGIEIGVLRSWKRQTLLAIFGAMLIIAGYIIQHSTMPQPPPVEILLFDNKNNDGVLNDPPRLAEFAISKPFYISSIWDYHYNQGRGSVPGNIMLRHNDGTIYGPWEVFASDTPSMQNWECKPRASFPAGTYTIVDSERATWSWNGKSNEMGMSKVRGYPVKSFWRWIEFGRKKTTGEPSATPAPQNGDQVSNLGRASIIRLEGTSSDQSDKIRTALTNAGYTNITMTTGTAKSFPNRDEVRFYYPADSRNAQSLNDYINKALGIPTKVKDRSKDQGVSSHQPGDLHIYVR